MTIKLIATDMEGTFLDGKGAYDKQRFDRVLSQLSEQDIHFVAASGRQLLALEAMFSAFTDRIIFVAENGGIVKYQDQILFEEKCPLIRYWQSLSLSDCLTLSREIPFY